VLEERIVKGPWAARFGLLAASFVPWEMGWKSGGGWETHEVLKVGWVGKGKEKVKGTEGGGGDYFIPGGWTVFCGRK
jgi:hypothetical protein